MSKMTTSPPAYEQFQNEMSEPRMTSSGASPYTAQYGNTQNSQNTTVVNVPATNVMTFVPDIVPEKWSWCNLVVSVFSVFCCTLFGFIAVVMAILSYVDHKVKDYPRSRTKRHVAWGFAVAAIVIGTVALIVLIAAVVIAINEPEPLEQAMSQHIDGLSGYEQNVRHNSYDE